MKSIYISTTISKPYEQICEFLSLPENFPLWATGLAEGEFKKDGELWLAKTPMGEMHLRFSAANKCGVFDHWVIPENGDEMYNPMRAIRNGAACDVVFTLFKRDGMSDEEFEKDRAWVQKDLNLLKELLESR